jgi:hypothetical protein
MSGTRTVTALGSLFDAILDVMETGPDAQTKEVLRAIFALVVADRKRLSGSCHLHQVGDMIREVLAEAATAAPTGRRETFNSLERRNG